MYYGGLEGKISRSEFSISDDLRRLTTAAFRLEMEDVEIANLKTFWLFFKPPSNQSR